MRYGFKTYAVAEDPRAATAEPGVTRILMLAAWADRYPAIPIAAPTLDASDVRFMDALTAVRDEIPAIRDAIAMYREGR